MIVYSSDMIAALDLIKIELLKVSQLPSKMAVILKLFLRSAFVDMKV